LDAYLSEAHADVSRARIKTSVELGLVCVNGAAQTKASYTVKAGDQLVWQLPPSPLSSAIPEAIPLDIAYEDASVIVINKRAGANLVARTCSHSRAPTTPHLRPVH